MPPNPTVTPKIEARTNSKINIRIEIKVDTKEETADKMAEPLKRENMKFACIIFPCIPLKIILSNFYKAITLKLDVTSDF